MSVTYTLEYLQYLVNTTYNKVANQQQQQQNEKIPLTNLKSGYVSIQVVLVPGESIQNTFGTNMNLFHVFQSHTWPEESSKPGKNLQK